MAALGVLLTLVAPYFQHAFAGRRQEILNRQLLGAALEGDQPAVLRLLSAGAEVNGCNERFNTALYYAVRTRNLSLVNVLLESGANPNQQVRGEPELSMGDEVRAPLSYAVQKNDLAIARRLLEAGADPNSSHVLFDCVERGQEPMLELLLQHGGSVNAVGHADPPPPSSSKYTGPPRPLLQAALESELPPARKSRILRIMQRHGADLTSRAFPPNAAPAPM
jgi:ankyrin repeat protein